MRNESELITLRFWKNGKSIEVSNLSEINSLVEKIRDVIFLVILSVKEV